MPRQWVEFLMVGLWGRRMIQYDPGEKRAGGDLQETGSSLAVETVPLIYTTASTEWELYMLNK